MIAFLSQPPTGFILAVAGILFAACLLIFLLRLTRMAQCGIFIAAGAVILSALAITVLALPLSYHGTVCGLAAGAPGLSSAGEPCHAVRQTVFETATWLGLASLSAAFVSFAPGLRVKPRPATAPSTALPAGTPQTTTAGRVDRAPRVERRRSRRTALERTSALDHPGT